jgi:radical SAM/Cys-rich protein
MDTMVLSFKDRLLAVNPEFETFESLQTLQVNLGNLCNLYCSHCHVNASSRGSEIMGVEVMEQIVRFLRHRPDLTLDITGGCPEMNPDFRKFIEMTDGLATRRMLRSNLAIMAEQGWEWLPEFCRAHDVTIIGSLPCYLEENVNRQRGEGVYQKCIQALKRLNALGYGSEVDVNLVYNPGGDFVPGSQQVLEGAYKAELLARHGIIFNYLFTITNAPIGRFREHLEADGTYSDYLRMLAGRFNPEAAANIMCRTLISVDWQGKLYNCDFNQALDMPVTADDGSEISISELEYDGMNGKQIHLSQHCYCCTAGEGSSCTGALVK